MDGTKYSDSDKTVFEEVVEIVPLPKFNAKAALEQEDPKDIELDPVVVTQLVSLGEKTCILFQCIHLSCLDL